jgi:RpiR family carbohydrate utilization transcriptional regulator
MSEPARKRRAASLPPPPAGSLLERIARESGDLRPSERRVADFVGRHPNDVLTLSIAALALRAGVSQPTVARFARGLGFSGYREFKLRLAQSLASGIPFVHHDVGPRDSPLEVANKVFDRSIATLLQVRNHLDPAALQSAIALMVRARRIEFYGLGNSGIVAMDAQHKFFRFGVAAAAHADAHVQGMAAVVLGRGGLVVAISASGRTADLVNNLEIARQSGAKAIGITRTGSPVARACDLVLGIDVPEDPDVYAPMTSRLAHLAVIDVLAVGLAVSRGSSIAGQLGRIKQTILARRIPEG